MSKHLERALGLADEQPDTSELTIQDYLGGAEDLDAPMENPVADAFASNTEVSDEYENPIESRGPEDPELGGPDPIFEPTEALSGFEDADLALLDDEESPSDDMRQALTQKFIEKAKERLLNSQRFQDRADMLNRGSTEEEGSGL